MHRSTPEASELSAWCVSFIAEMLECPPARIDPNAKFSRIGLDSAMSVQLIVALEALLDRELSPDTVVNHPTIARLSAYLARLGDQT